jgi:hypothetical protein
MQLRHVARAQGGEHRAVRRGQDLVHAEVGRDPAAVQRAVAAVGEHGELGREVAADPQFLGQPVGHLLVHLGLDQPGHLDRVQVQVVPEFLVDGEFRPGAVQLDLAARVAFRGQVAEQQVRVGDGGPQPATVVAGGAGVRTGTARPYLDGLVQPVVAGDGPAASAQRDQVNHRHADQPPVDDRHEVVVLDPVRRDQADVVAGAAHIGGHHVAKTGLAGQVLSGRDTGHRPGVDGLQRIGGVQLGHPAGVVDDQHRPGITVLAQVLLQFRQRVVHGGVQEAVDDGRGGAHVFAFAPGQLMAEQHRDRAQLMGRVLGQEDLLHPQFVRWVLGRVGEADHERLGARVDDRTQRLPDVLGGEVHEHGAGVVDAFPHGADQGLRHQRVGTGAAGHVVLGQLVQAFSVAPAARQRDGGLEPGGHDDADLRAAPFDQRVRAQGGGVANRVDLAEHVVAPQVQGGAGVVERLVEALRQVVVGGQRLGLDVAVFPGHEAVGEGAADVDRDPFHVMLPLRGRRRRAAARR